MRAHLRTLRNATGCRLGAALLAASLLLTACKPGGSPEGSTIRIGQFASLLGDAGVNIATFNLGRHKQGGDAIALVEVDGVVPADVLAKTLTLPHVKQAKALTF